MYQIVEGKDEDRDDFVKLAWKSFEPTANLSELKKEHWVNYWNQPEKEDWAYVAKYNGQLVANLSFFKHTFNKIRGNTIPFAAIWAVATEPAHRRRGLVRKLFQKTFPIMREKGMSLSVLDPFSTPFYEKFGYARAEQRALHEFDARFLRIAEPTSEIIAVETDDTSTWREMHKLEESMTRFGSRAYHTKRTLDYIIKQNHFYYFKKDGEIIGSLLLYYKKDNDALVLTASNTFYKNAEALAAIVSLVYHHAANADKVLWYTDIETPLDYFFKEARTKSKMIGSMMMRILDVLPYLELVDIPVEADRSVTIELVDEFCQWNSGIYQLKPQDGKINAEVTAHPSDNHIKIDALNLSRVISGLTTATHLRGFGLIDCSLEVARRLEAMFPANSFYTYQRF
ncbi:MAG: GNAT family N-acetyltransferase [Candidatus Lokiarchaeota archaeon]|nr:GNAT family N-acetyltransferase [Candidatus Lokiarchaeota archaeon]